MALNPNDTLLNGHYRILRLLGRGGFGFVYLAEDTLLHNQVAIKELIPALVGDDAMLKRFLAEARATMRLTHKHIVRTHNVFQEGENYYIVMEYMAGGSLEERLRERGPLPVDEAVRVAAEVCEGLACAHEEQVVHCDLKPANILFDASGRAKVADFGIAHVSGEMLTRSWMTPAGFVAGTLPYMSPEQAEGVRDDPRLDVYALGAVLYRMLTGRTYLDFDPQETPVAQARNVARICEEAPRPPSQHNQQVPPWLDGVVLKALAKHSEGRYGSVEAMHDGLLQQQPAAVGIVPSTRAVSKKQRATPVSAAQRKGPWPTWVWAAGAGAAVLLILLIISIGALRREGNTAAEPTAVLTKTPEQTLEARLAPTETPILTNTLPPTETATPTPTEMPVPTDTLMPSATPEPTETPTTEPSKPEPTSTPAGLTPTSQTGTQAPPADTSFGYGIQADMVDGGQAGMVMGKVREIGFGWVKQQVEWKDVEKAKGSYEWGPLDEIERAADAAEVKILWSVASAPRWARGGQDLSVDGPPNNPGDLADFLDAMASRYCGTSAKAIEVWNEQNVHYGWGNMKIEPAAYMNLLKPAYNRIKAACPSMIVVSGALAPTGVPAPLAMDDVTYLEGMYKNGLKGYSDAIGAHPTGYNVAPWVPGGQDACDFVKTQNSSFMEPCNTLHHSWSFYSTLHQYYNLMRKYGDSYTRIWPTGFGWATNWIGDDNYGYALDNTRQEQAEWTVNAYESMKQWGFVGVAFLSNLNHSVVAPRTEDAQWSIVEEDWTPTQTYNQLKSMVK